MKGVPRNTIEFSCRLTYGSQGNAQEAEAFEKNTTANERILVCNCQRTMQIDGDELARNLGRDGLPIHRELCRSGLDSFREALAAGAPVHVACTQEAPLFEEVAATEGADGPLRFTNIRETAGWTGDSGSAMPKMVALLAESEHQPQMTSSVSLTSEGVCLVVGRGQAALDAAKSLAGRLSPILLLTDPGDALPPTRDEFPVFTGTIRSAAGAMGEFRIAIANCARAEPSSRDAFAFGEARREEALDVDLVLDLSGNPPLFTGHDRRDGYLRVDAGDPAAVARSLFEISDLVGEFEKPRYVAYDASICAHARSGKVGCTNCLDVCPLGAISPSGDHVAIDASICGGCGNCASVCPTGAASYTVPYRSDLIARMSILVSRFLQAGGKRPVLLAHDEKHGADLIDAMARFGRGLPSNVIPLVTNSVFSIGHEALAAGIALGAERVLVLVPPKHPEEAVSLERQTALADAFLSGLGYGEGRLALLMEADPDAVETALYEPSDLSAVTPGSLTAVGAKREVARTVLSALHAKSEAKPEIIALPDAAPYGRVQVDTDGCTLCLACVSACPTNALRDNPEKPQLSFVESACVQCGICVATCPEKVIGLEPRYNFTTAALSPLEIKSEEPFHCVSCGKAFGARSSIERIVDRLRGHSMFQNEDQLRLIQMCDNCRVVALAKSGNDPMAAGNKPPVRTTDDYLAEGRNNTTRKPDDFLS